MGKFEPVLVISGLNLEEIQEVNEKIREIEQRDPSRTFFIWIKGYESFSIQQTVELLKKIFPKKKKNL